MIRTVQMYKGNAALYNAHQGLVESGRTFNFRRQDGKYYFSLNQPSFFTSIQATLEACEIVEVQINDED